MKYFWLVSLNILLIQAIESRSHYRQKRVVHGENALPGEFPYQISLQDIISGYHHCGGSIVNRYFVLTAGHCVKGLNADELKVVSGVIDLDDNRRFTTNVDDIILYEGYTLNREWENDVALVKVTTPFNFDEFTGAAKLPEPYEEVPINALAFISGFGREYEHSRTSKILKKAEVTIDPLSFCKDKYNNTVDLTNAHLCVFDNSDPMQGICKGDSGGPLTLNGTVIGVASFADHGCSNGKMPTVFTKLSKYADWIKKNSELPEAAI